MPLFEAKTSPNVKNIASFIASQRQSRVQQRVVAAQIWEAESMRCRMEKPWPPDTPIIMATLRPRERFSLDTDRRIRYRVAIVMIEASRR